MPHLALSSALRHPRTQMRRFAAEPPTLSTLPMSTRAGLVGIAVGGSTIYGASLSLRFPRWRPTSGALWLARFAGLGWCVFGPTLVLVTRCNALTCAHACLVTMAYDEAVRVSGAAANLLQTCSPPGNQIDPLRFNLATVGYSNIVTAAVRALHSGTVPSLAAVQWLHFVLQWPHRCLEMQNEVNQFSMASLFALSTGSYHPDTTSLQDSKGGHEELLVNAIQTGYRSTP